MKRTDNRLPVVELVRFKDTLESKVHVKEAENSQMSNLVKDLEIQLEVTPLGERYLPGFVTSSIYSEQDGFMPKSLRKLRLNSKLIWTMLLNAKRN
jgi:hypothetical protein